MLPPYSLEQAIQKTVQEEWGRILAALNASLRDLQLAEDCLQEAVLSAMKHWSKNGLPKSPAAWLLTVSRRKAIDVLRRNQNFASKQAEISYLYDLENTRRDDDTDHSIPDHRLEMIFICCHPILDEKSKTALTLRSLGGLSTEQIARAFLDKPDAMQKRLARAKAKIKAANLGFSVPEATDLPERWASVLSVIYLIFNEGYSARAGAGQAQKSLVVEAIRLARILVSLRPEDTETKGLLALMLLSGSRQNARLNEDAQMVSLEEQNRAKWDQNMIAEGIGTLKEVLPQGRLGPYQLQAAISAVHAQAKRWEDTDWAEIEALYGLLYKHQPTVVIRINHAVAISYAQSAEAGLIMLDKAAEAKQLGNYQPYFAARADLLARASRIAEARECYATAIRLSKDEKEQAFLEQKLKEVSRLQ